ncbi:MAG: cellulase family glycosylhydrolase [Candidatus Promineifilaceae bacterium]|nr:cellulase family glycosylhydrolase [Candidatus Promineifilaceae bacterium]
MWRRLVVLIASVLFLLSLWPPTMSLYGLTGEETLPGQMRGLLHWFHTALRPQPLLAPDAEVAHTDVVPFGANTFLQNEARPDVREESLRLLQEAGFRFIRQEFTWEDIEIDAKGDFVDRRNDPQGVDAWAKYDQIVNLAEAYDVEIIARLSNPPAWTRALTDTVGAYAPPDDYDDYGDFVAAVAERYEGRIRYFQLWNEPNIYPEWGEQPVDPEAFTRLLCTGYRRARQANPEAVILAPALAPTVEVSDRALNGLIFLERMYEAGAGDCFDVMSVQAYGLWSGPSDRRLRPTVINYPYHLYTRDIMVRQGDAEKPIWVSEMGWNTVPEPLPPYFGRVTEAQQARYTVEGFERARAEWPWMGVVNVWFFKRVSDEELSQPFYYFRMMEPDFTPLPVWTAVAQYAPHPGPVDPQPAWLYLWQRLRPALFLLGGSIFFFSVLIYLAPGEDARKL